MLDGWTTSRIRQVGKFQYTKSSQVLQIWGYKNWRHLLYTHFKEECWLKLIRYWYMQMVSKGFIGVLDLSNPSRIVKTHIKHCATKSKVRFTKTDTWPWPLSSCSGRLTGVENEKNLSGLCWPPEIQPGEEQGHPQPRGCTLEHFFITQGYNKKLSGSFCTHFRPPRTPWRPATTKRRTGSSPA